MGISRSFVASGKDDELMAVIYLSGNSNRIQKCAEGIPARDALKCCGVSRAATPGLFPALFHVERCGILCRHAVLRADDS